MDIKKLLGLLAKQSDEAAPAGQKLLNYGSQTAPEVLEQADELLPAIRKNTLPTEVAPEVIGKGTSRAASKADDIIDAEIIAPKVSTMDSLKQFAKENPGKIAGGLTLAEIARQMSGGSTPPPMMTPPPQDKELDASVVKEADLAALPSIPKKAPLSATDQARAGMDKFMANIPQDTQPAELAGPSMEDMYAERLSGAQDADSQNQFINTLIRAANQAGSAIAGSKADYSGVEALEKGAGRNVANFKEGMATRASSQNLKKAENEINDEQKLRDPNSEISKQTREQLAKYGINVKSAMEAKQLNPQIFNLLMADRAQKNAKEVAAMGLEVKKQKEGKELDNKQRKFARDLRKEATTGVLGKQYATFSTGQRMSSSLAEFIKNPSGYKDYATLMGGLKSLQGDESVVREAEMRLGINATSLINKAQNYLSAAATGKSLQPSQRKEMLDTINILTDASRKQYMQSVAPILEQAEMEGIPSSMILSGSLQGADDEDKESESKGLTTPTGASGLVKVTRNEDGKSKMMTPEAAARADKTKFTIGN